MCCWNTKQQTKKNAATVSGAAFQRREKQISDRASSSGCRRRCRLAATWAHRQVQRAADANQQGTKEQGNPAEQGEIDGHAKQQAVRHRAGGLN